MWNRKIKLMLLLSTNTQPLWIYYIHVHGESKSGDKLLIIGIVEKQGNKIGPCEQRVVFMCHLTFMNNTYKL